MTDKAVEAGMSLDDTEKNSSTREYDDKESNGFDDDVERQEGSLRRHISSISAAGVAPSLAETKMAKGQTASDDPNAVGWDGPSDPNNPLNWPARKKWSNIGALSIMTILTPLGSSMFAPGVPDIMREFKSTNENLATFVVSVYVLGFAFGPLIAAPMSEIYGRAICYNIANVLFIIFTVGTALSQNMGMLIGFRFLMGLAGSCPITNGSGTVSDMFPVEQRGRAMALWAMGPLLGPCIGPVAGGYIVQYLGWRWVFWILAIASGLIAIVCVFLVTETYHPTLVGRKVARLRKETSNSELYNALEDHTITEGQRLKLAIIRPLKILIRLPTVLVMSLYIAVIFGIMYLMLSTFTFVFGRQYSFSSGTVGLSYIPTGVGCMLGMVLLGTRTDQIVKKKLDRGETPVPEDRLPPIMTISSGVIVVGALFMYGWTTEYAVHWIVPMIAVALFCFGLMGIMMCVQIYLVDCYIRYAASVIAAITVFRSIIGALLPLGGLSLYNSLGYGWGNGVLAFIALVMVPMPVVFKLYGAKIRAKTNVKL